MAPLLSEAWLLVDFLGPLREKHKLYFRTVLDLFISNDLFLKILQCKFLADHTATILSLSLHRVSNTESPENKASSLSS